MDTPSFPNSSAATPLAKDLWRSLLQTATFRDMARELDGGARQIIVTGLWGAAQALAIGALHAASGKPVLVVTPTRPKAEQLAADLEALARLHHEEYQEDLDTGFEGDWHAVVREKATERQPVCHLLRTLSLDPAHEHARIREAHELLLGTLSALADDLPLLVVAPVESLLHKVVPRSYFRGHELNLEIGKPAPPLVDLAKHLHQLGYVRRELVEAPGEYCVRGGLVDVFVPTLARPVRLEYFGDDLESLREFDPVTQRSLAQLLSLTLPPAHQTLLEDHSVELALRRLNTAAKEGLIPENKALEWLQRVRDRRGFEEIPGSIGLFFDDLVSPLEYFPKGTLIVVIEPESVEERLAALEAETRQNYLGQEMRFFSAPEMVLNSQAEVRKGLDRFPRLECDLFQGMREIEGVPIFSCEIKNVGTYRGHLDDLIKDLPTLSALSRRVVLVAPNRSLQDALTKEIVERELGELVIEDDPKPGQRELFLEEATPSEGSFPPRITVVCGHLTSGFNFPEASLVLLGTADIYGEKKRQVQTRQRPTVSSLKDLKEGDFVVHLDLGVAKYAGLKTLNMMGKEQDFLLLLYKDDDKLYLPMENLHLIQRYASGEAGHARIDKLGGQAWLKTKTRVKQAIREMAVELLKLYAARQVVKRPSFSTDGHWHREFDATFDYEETPDQLAAIEAVKGDLERPAPMDRLVCGDVGFGKTEVAMRAAFKVVMDGRQVAVLVPTTILAQQHLNTFRRRFQAFPVTTEMVSRFCTPKETTEIKKKVAAGEIDIIIGTHRLLSKDIHFKDLGLIVVDEEQRFGVNHKERLKQLRTKVDVLTLTATPIPRTLHMSLMGVRDMSLINTAPENRLAIKTLIRKFAKETVETAIRQELKRGGQIYFVHNRVESIYSMADFVKKLVPDARVGVGHGQMHEDELEKVMLGFLNREFDILVATTIIESGLDIPSVNTIIINRADRLGLAQLYQLRGRVGREQTQAYAYLLIPSVDLLSEDAKKRLRVIEELTELGSGFRLASYDLDIRGAGNLLGSEQSGHIEAVGVDLYLQLIDETVRELRGEEIEQGFEPQIQLPFTAAIPKSYLRDTGLRLSYYQYLSMARSPVELTVLEEEMNDRFGPLPVEAKALIQRMELRLACLKYRVEKCEATANLATLVFRENAPISPKSLLNLVREQSGELRFVPPRSLTVRLDTVKPEMIVPHMQALLTHLQFQRPA